MQTNRRAYGGKVKLWRQAINKANLGWSAALVFTLVGVWAIVSRFTAPYILPTPDAVYKVGIHAIEDPTLRSSLILTLIRVFAGIMSSFLLGAVVGLAAGASRSIAKVALPLTQFIQGIPSLSWVVIAVIWFKDVEVRVWFILVIVTVPGFVLQISDSYRALPKSLYTMVRSFRPTRFAIFRDLIFPGILPGIFTAWKVQLGLGARVVLVAELVGASVGVGAQLLTAQQLFNMAGVIAWTLLLAISLLVFQGLLTLIESYGFRYRASPEGDE